MRPTGHTLVIVPATLLLAVALANGSIPTFGAKDAAARTNPEPLIRAETIALPPQISARLAWARSHLAPSGIQKLERIARQLAPGIATGVAFAGLRSRGERDIAGSCPRLSGMEVSDAAFIVLAMAAEDMDNEIRMILPEFDNVGNAKEKLRDTIADLNAWIAREMGEHSASGDLDDQSLTSGSPGPTPAAPLRPHSVVALETRSSPVARIRYVHVSAVPPLPTRTSAPGLAELRALRDANVATLGELGRLSAELVARLRLILDYREKYVSELSEMMAKAATTQDTLVQNLK